MKNTYSIEGLTRTDLGILVDALTQQSRYHQRRQNVHSQFVVDVLLATVKKKLEEVNSRPLTWEVEYYDKRGKLMIARLAADSLDDAREVVASWDHCVETVTGHPLFD